MEYYVEFGHCSSNENYVLQSKWFDSLKKAYNWYINNFDYTSDEIRVDLMCYDGDDIDIAVSEIDSKKYEEVMKEIKAFEKELKEGE